MPEFTPTLLFYIQLPPPTHGTSSDNKRIVNSDLLRESFEVHIREVTTAEDIDDLGNWSLSKIVRSLRSFLGLYWQALGVNPDAIYVTPAPSGPAFYRDAFFYSILKALGYTLITRIKGRGFSSGGPLKEWIAQRMLSETYPVILSERLKYDVENFVDPSRIRVLPNGIPDPYLDRSIEWPDESSPFSFLYLSNWHPSKGLERTLKAFAELEGSASNSQLNVAGNPTSDLSRDDVLEKCDELGITDRVNLVGSLYGDEKFEKFRVSDVFVFPTRYKRECFPFVVLEAMSAGLPVVSTALAAIPDMVEDGWNGYLLEPSCSTQELSKALEKLRSDEERCRLFGRRSRERFEEKFKFDKAMDQYRGLFLDILDVN